MKSAVIPRIAVVVPCYNEKAVVPETAKRLSVLVDGLVINDRIHKESRICFVDDGSTDNTWGQIVELNRRNTYIIGLKLSRNFGHQHALLSGLLHVKNRFDCVISIDADLQDDVEVIREFVEKFKQGCDVVYGVRESRTTDSFFKKNSALLFYRMMKVFGVDVLFNHADYRLCSSRVLDHLEEYQEANLFLRGLIPLIGYKSDIVYYNRAERFAGTTKYPLKKMISFAIEGITSFSVVPLRLIALAGIIVFLFSVVMSVNVFYHALLKGDTVPGWASTVLPIYFIGGVQLLSIALVGEYIGKIYKEVKRRPRYIIEATLPDESQ
jgi:glycosyltransferase involved in cell wall biosynthesis